LQNEQHNIDDLIHLGKLCFFKGYNFESYECFKIAEILEPNNYELRFYFALNMLAFNDTKGCIENLEKAIKIEPNKKDAYLALGRLYIDLMKRYNDSIYYHNKYINIDQNCPIAYFNLGLCYYCLRDDDKAIDFFIKCLSLDSERITPYFENLIILLRKKKRYQECIDLLKAELLKRPLMEAEILRDIGLVFKEMGDFENSLQYLHDAYEKRPDIYIFMYDFVNLSLEMGRLDNSILALVDKIKEKQRSSDIRKLLR
ncbi:MAG: tetratricopeptide repeat protein, partial [Desulfobacterales bacterium]|nr:tetratricopeptide repeat protein [Desulfobacterales bacterium]